MSDRPTPESMQMLLENLEHIGGNGTVAAKVIRSLEREADELREKLNEARRVVTRLVRYADRTADKHPNAVTSAGQNARVVGAMWLARTGLSHAEKGGEG